MKESPQDFNFPLVFRQLKIKNSRAKVYAINSSKRMELCPVDVTQLSAILPANLRFQQANVNWNWSYKYLTKYVGNEKIYMCINA